MKTIEQIITESLNRPKPIHLFKNDDSYVSKYAFDGIVNHLNDTWPAALQSDHEDEYLYIDSTNPDFEKYYNKIKDTKQIAGIGTLGLGKSDWGWKAYDTSRPQYPVYSCYTGTNDLKTFNSVIVADKSFFEEL